MLQGIIALTSSSPIQICNVIEDAKITFRFIQLLSIVKSVKPKIFKYWIFNPILSNFSIVLHCLARLIGIWKFRAYWKQQHGDFDLLFLKLTSFLQDAPHAHWKQEF